MMQKLFVLALLLGQVYISTTEKVGICKPAPAFGPCVITCGADEDCDGIHKCCSNGCGAWCSEPTCPLKQTKVDCPASLCNYVGCPGKPQESVQCSVDFCNQCIVSFRNVTTGDPVDCGPVETLCPRMLSSTNQHLLGQYRPKCDKYGAFEKIQCHEGYCFCVDTRSGVPDMSTSVRGTPKCPEKTLCQKQVDEAMKLPPIGRFVPQCKSDGSFQEKRYHLSTGQCWCVDSYGREWFGTRSHSPTLDCTASVCPSGVTQLKCDPVLCHTAKCPGYEKASCRVNPCGQCKPEFLDQYNRQIKYATTCTTDERREEVDTSCWTLIRITEDLYRLATKKVMT
ncbi:nidogen-2-like [Actinia tenebrosa]|uniref:Nidogen-2-like n=1 Tax=Actinia tenebrosa TaxID=6105 RepID=A0A6P8ID15_ACTTE|nr:nidogen-2-like [Actinia tenebrosa]